MSTTNGFSFTLLNPSSTRFGPRLGNAVLRRPEHNATIQLQTPALLATTSRGVVPHLSRDHYSRSSALKWTHIPFETFLEQPIPVPTLQKGTNPLHTFLGFSKSENILSISARNPSDGQEMPTNGNAHISTQTLRGVRKVSPEDWRKYSLACKPDVVVALSDTPFTNPPYSQKRLTKSIERSAAWIISLIKPEIAGQPLPFSIFVHLAGNTSIPARKAFASSLLEPLYGPEAALAQPYTHLDQAISGYTFDLVPLVQSIEATQPRDAYVGEDAASPTHAEAIIPLLQASLDPLPVGKLRLVNSVQTPHDILRLISSVGVDLFDAHWVQRAADIGVALDFQFPAPQAPERKDLGRNIYDLKYAKDFSPLSDSFRGEVTSQAESTKPICPCAACSPIQPPSRLYHGIDTPEYAGDEVPSMDRTYLPSFTRAYIHHLLHTHEMSAHTLLTMHNLAVVESFFSGIRAVLEAGDGSRWAEEVNRFLETYDESLAVLKEATASWKEVELARGKGRLAREKAKEDQGGVIE